MARGMTMLVPVFLEAGNGTLISLEEVAAAVLSSKALSSCVWDLRDWRAVLPRGRIDLSEPTVYEKLTKKDASRFTRALRAQLSIELTNHSARILAARLLFGRAPDIRPKPSGDAVVIDLQSWKLARGSRRGSGKGAT